jgi:nucleoside-diphosphate-sugar epimerase
VSDPPFAHDVKRRVPSTEKAKRVLGFEATTSLTSILQDVVPWIEKAVADGTI